MYLMISSGGYDSIAMQQFDTIDELKKYVHGMSVERTKNHAVYKIEAKHWLPELMPERHMRTVEQCVNLSPMEFKSVTFEAYGKEARHD